MDNISPFEAVLTLNAVLWYGVGDTLTTLFAYYELGLAESNPVMAAMLSVSPYAFVAMKVWVTLSILYGIKWLYLHDYGRWARAYIVFWVALGAFLFLNNLYRIVTTYGSL